MKLTLAEWTVLFDCLTASLRMTGDEVAIFTYDKEARRALAVSLANKMHDTTIGDAPPSPEPAERCPDGGL